jgi:hypothetical protein
MASAASGPKLGGSVQRYFSIWSLVSSVFVTLSHAKPALAIDWQSEVNVSICNWEQLRGESVYPQERAEVILTHALANIIRDTIYLDGGSIWWEM